MSKEYYKQIPSAEMMDFERFYWRMASELSPGGFVAEIGTANGRSVIYLASQIKAMKKTCRIYAIDNLDYGKEAQRLDILRNIIKSECEDVISFIEADSLRASCRFEDKSFDFVFVDGSHKYEDVKADIRLWLPKVRVGGIIAGHDYWSPQNECGVKKAVDELIPAHKLRTEATDNGWGVWWTKIEEDV